MVDILHIGFLIVGFMISYILSLYTKRGDKVLHMFNTAIKKRIPIMWLETDKGVYFKLIRKVHKNLAITFENDIIIMPKGSVKPCLNLGGVEMGHGDLYKSVATPQDLRLFLYDLEKDGWSKDEIANFFSQIEATPPEQLKAMYLDEEKINNPNPDDKNKIIKSKFKVFITLPSTVKDFILTGLNRTSIHLMLKELVYQRDLEKPQGRNWIPIAVAAFIIVVAIAFAARWILTPEVVEAITSQPRIAP